MQRVTVFCGSKTGANPRYRESATAMGRLLAQRECGLVFGGGSVGLMGVVSDAVLEAGGEVIGVIPQSLATKELLHTGVADMRVVASMHDRKALMAELSDAFIALPGGFGTFEELFEVILGCSCHISKPSGCGQRDRTEHQHHDRTECQQTAAHGRGSV